MATTKQRERIGRKPRIHQHSALPDTRGNMATHHGPPIGKKLFLLIAAVALAGCVAETLQPTSEPVQLEISPLVDVIFVNDTVDFRATDAVTGEPVGQGSGGASSAPTACPGTGASCAPMAVTPPLAWLPTRPPSG